MSKNLILVESPSKAKTINKYLGRNYKVEATVGHVKNLPKSKLGIDIENGYEPKFLNIRGKGDIINKIKKLSSKSEKIYIATDPDREGEAIAQDIVEIINGKTKAKIYRVLFNEITKNSVKKAIASPKEIDSHLVSSQRARRVMDRIIGYKISPFLWQTIIEHADNSLSAGRVQSVALRLICEREEEIEKFIETEYWTLKGMFNKNEATRFSAGLYSIDERILKIPPKPKMTDEEWEEFYKTNSAINSKEEAEKVYNDILNSKEFTISDIQKKEQKRNPAPPFITSSLQAEASKRLSFRPRKTMQIAQQLYEGIDLGDSEGTVGLITYMRTDSTRLSQDIVNDAREHIYSKYGPHYKPDKPRVFAQKKKNVQDAHEAIRPTSVLYSPDRVKNYLNKDQMKLYELIWLRFLASQMESARVETTAVLISSGRYTFRTSGTVIKFDGFLRIYEEASDDVTDNNEKNILPEGLEKEDLLALEKLAKEQHFTKPPARFSESTLIKELENNNVGRPSTYALIVSTIQDRNYVEMIDRRFKPTGVGKKVNYVLVNNFPSIIDVNFTAQMEDELDSIASGEIDYNKVLDDFYIPFKSVLEEVEKNIEKIKCEVCGSDMDLKVGPFGKYLQCTNEDCKKIKSLKEISQENKEPEFTGEICPKDKGRLVYREGKFGKFIGCENYPDCDYTEQITLGIKCPKCNEGDVVPRYTRRKRIFYGCSRYPECDFASWKMPKTEEEKENESED